MMKNEKIYWAGFVDGEIYHTDFGETEPQDVRKVKIVEVQK